jgi:hypothetical protein
MKLDDLEFGSRARLQNEEKGTRAKLLTIKQTGLMEARRNNAAMKLKYFIFNPP